MRRVWEFGVAVQITKKAKAKEATAAKEAAKYQAAKDNEAKLQAAEAEKAAHQTREACFHSRTPPLSRTALPFLHPPLSRESPGLTK